MKLSLSLVLIVLVFLVGCIQEEVVPIPEEPEIEVVGEPPQEQPPVVIPAPERELTKEEKEIQGLKENAERLKSYKYLYRDPRHDPSLVFPYSAEFFVKGNRMKASLLTPDEEVSARLANVGQTDTIVYRKLLYDDESYFDTLFFNLDVKKAVGSCLNNQCQYQGNAIPLRFADYIRKTPLDWTREIPLPGATIYEEKMIESKRITKVEYTKEGTRIILWLEDYSGLPLRVEFPDDITKGDLNILRFDTLSVNSVRDSDFEIRI